MNRQFCPEGKCKSELVYYEDEFQFYRCYRCRKIFNKPKIVKKKFKTVSLFGE